MGIRECAWNCNRWVGPRGLGDRYNKRRSCTCGGSMNRSEMMQIIENDLGPMTADNHAEYIRRIKEIES